MPHLITHTKSTESDKAGWHERQILNAKRIAELENPDEATGDRPVRSIPSPFAPMHLAKEAMLQYVDLGGAVSADTKRVISDALDVGVLFFELAERSDLIDALYFPWESIDPRSPNYSGSDRLNAALRLFRKEDGDQYGLNTTEQLHLLTSKNNAHLVYGGTCPETMFFAAPAYEDWNRETVSIGDDILFDHKPALLHERAEDYVHWFYGLYAELRANNIVDTAFCCYLKYVREKELSTTQPELAKTIAARLNESSSDYYHKTYRPVTDAHGHDIIIARGVSLRGQKAELDDDVESSFYMLVEERRRHRRMPLAIPQSAVGASNYSLIPGEAYRRGKHRPKHRLDEAPTDRTLPGLGTKKYPFLTTDDFLEPTLMRVPYPLDARFWLSVKHPDGARADGPLHDFLLPLRSLFFKYFSVDALLSTEKGTPGFRVSGSEEAYTTFTLDIPLANGGTASFSRQYYPQANVTQDGSTGTRLNVSFGLAMFPSYLERERFEHQRLMVITKVSDAATSPSTITLFDSESPEAAPSDPLGIDWSAYDGHRTHTYQPKARFDAIELSTALPGERGVLIPRRRATAGSDKLVFSVDFGTTNTHVEVSRQSSLQGPLGSPELTGYTALSHPMVVERAVAGPIDRTFLINNNLLKYQTQPEDLLPTHIGPGGRIRFPIRTASVENGDAITLAAVASHTIAVPWGYPVRNYPSYAVTPNLKWATSATQERTQKRAKAFIETLCMMMRTYALETRGDLSQVELVWFYPTSMMVFETDLLKDMWERAFEKYFAAGAKTKVQSLPESLAPFYAWRAEDGLTIESRPTVIADIGGGTCDVTVFQANRGETKVRRVSSYKFAGNTIFGDGKGTTKSNGFITAFVNKVAEAKGRHAKPANFGAKFEVNPGIAEELDRFRGREQSIELINYWFSLAGTQAVADDFDFSRLIRGTDYMRVPFVVYFAALAYKISTDMAAEGIPPPGFLAFSGNGSRMLDFLSNSSQRLEEFFDVAFATARGQDADGDAARGQRLKVFASGDPKPLTARGGLYYMDTAEALDPDWSKRKESSRTVAEASDPEVLGEEMAYFSGFVDFLRAFFDEYDIREKLGIARTDLAVALDIFSDVRTARGHMEEVAIELTASLYPGEEISRQMFFFPLERMLPEIARALSQKHNT